MQDVFDESTRFADLGLRSSLLKGLDAAGFAHPTHIQAKLIRPMLEGRDLLGQAKTGTGKTAAFSLPIIHGADKSVTAQALILAPTRELAVQLVAEFDELAKFTPIHAVAITGGASAEKQRTALKRGAQVVVGTPGRVMDLHQRKVLPFDRLRWVILDEVDRMLDIGFREDIRKILSRVKQPHQTVFVSATISDEIERLSRRFMRDDAEKIVTVAKSLTVSQVDQKYVPVAKHDKKRMLVHLLTHETAALTLVFCRMKVTVREVARHLKDHGIDAHEIHADLNQSKRNRIMKRLREGNLEVLVASDLASRGLDVQGITHIINYDLPDDPEVYVHRIGRTARAGRTGVAWSFVEPEQGQLLTEIEKLTSVLLERLEYPDFQPGTPPEARDAEGGDPTRPTDPGLTTASRFTEGAPAHATAEPEPDPEKFPGGVIPSGSPQRRLGSRLKTRRNR